MIEILLVLAIAGIAYAAGRHQGFVEGDAHGYHDARCDINDARNSKS
jgi:hypothetical protein